MNSIFSSFDAACGEFLGQLKMKSSSPNSIINNKVVDRKSEQKGRFVDKTDEEKPSHSAIKKPQPQRRFALELDGINCFETLV